MNNDLFIHLVDESLFVDATTSVDAIVPVEEHERVANEQPREEVATDERPAEEVHAQTEENAHDERTEEEEGDTKEDARSAKRKETKEEEKTKKGEEEEEEETKKEEEEEEEPDAPVFARACGVCDRVTEEVSECCLRKWCRQCRDEVLNHRFVKRCKKCIYGGYVCRHHQNTVPTQIKRFVLPTQQPSCPNAKRRKVSLRM